MRYYIVPVKFAGNIRRAHNVEYVECDNIQQAVSCVTLP